LGKNGIKVDLKNSMEWIKLKKGEKTGGGVKK